MLLSIEPRIQLPEAVTASVGVVFIAAALSWSVLRNRRNASAAAQTGRNASAAAQTGRNASAAAQTG